MMKNLSEIAKGGIILAFLTLGSCTPAKDADSAHQKSEKTVTAIKVEEAAVEPSSAQVPEARIRLSRVAIAFLSDSVDAEFLGNANQRWSLLPRGSLCAELKAAASKDASSLALAQWQIRCEIEDAKFSLGFAESKEDQEVVALLERINALLTRDQTLEPLRIEAARLYLAQGEVEEARKQLAGLSQSVLRYDAEAQSCLGLVRLLSGDADGALEALERAAHLEAKLADRFSTLGAVAMLGSHGKYALNAYQQALLLEPKNSYKLADVGSAELALGRPERALAYFEEALELGPERVSLLSNLGLCLLQLGELDRAEKALKRGLELEPNFASAHLNLGLLWAKRRKFDQAEKEFRRAEAINPKDPRVQENLKELELERSGKK